MNPNELPPAKPADEEPDPADQRDECLPAGHDRDPAGSGPAAVTPPLEAGGEAARTLGWPDVAWDRYRCDRLLGTGGMGRVFKAWDPRLRRWVALKFLTGDNPELAARFLREAQAQARIEHPHVCRVYEVGEVAGRHYIAMQFIDGEPLGRCDSGLTLEQKALVIRQVADAIQAAHRLGIIHRDVKPANIMLERTEGQLRPFVVDFGLVREIGAEGLTETGAAIGTPQFMSPEQALGKARQVDRRTDVYSLGATLYALVAGHPPLGGETPVETLLRVIHEEPVPLRKAVPGVPRDLDTIAMKCLEKEPARRYDSARALAEDLGRFLDGEPVTARPTGWAYRLGKRMRKNRLLVAVAAVAVVVSLVLLGLWWHARRSAAAQAELAQQFTRKVERVEGLLWRAQSLEPHDIRPVRALVRKRLGEIEAEVRRLGAVAQGPGHSALGRGYVALHEYERGRRHLERAWQSGQRTPEVAYALGLALGKLYERELRELRHLPDRKSREARRKEIEGTLRDPARRYLRQCAGEDLAAPEYVEALLAYYENRDAEALVKTREAFHRVPWLYEALQLEGALHRRRGDACERKGEYAAARAAFEDALSVLRRAAEIGRSDAAVYTEIVNLWYNLLHMEVWEIGQADEQTYLGMQRAGERALQVDPDNLFTLTVMIEGCADWTEHLLFQGQNAANEIDAARRLFQQTLKIDQNNVRLLIAAAGVCWQEGKNLVNTGGDPRAVFGEGIRYLQRASAKDPSYFNSWNTKGLIYMDQAIYERSIQADPSDSLRCCVEALQRARQLAPTQVAIPINLALADLTLLEYQVRAGVGDPDQTAERARQALREAVKLNANLHWIPRIRGAVEMELARRAVQGTGDPRPVLARAEADMRRSLELDPDNLDTLCCLCDIRLLGAQADLRDGRSPAENLRHARSFLRQVQRASPGWPRAAGLERRLRQMEDRRPRSGA